MPRPKRVTDEDVLDAANALLAENGLSSFTLADVGRATGLSRAALIQRFTDRDNLLLVMAEREVVATRDYLASLPVKEGAEGLWSFLTTIVESMGNGESFSVRVAIAALEARDPKLKALAAERYALVQAAIAERIPDTENRDGLARHLHAVIAGATMQWVANGEGALSGYVLQELRIAFSLIFRDIKID